MRCTGPLLGNQLSLDTESIHRQQQLLHLRFIEDSTSHSTCLTLSLASSSITISSGAWARQATLTPV